MDGLLSKHEVFSELVLREALTAHQKTIPTPPCLYEVHSIHPRPITYAFPCLMPVYFGPVLPLDWNGTQEFWPP